MKQVLQIIGVLLVVIACSSPKGVVQVKENNQDTVATDSVEYDLETFDSRFETWYTLQKSPSQYRSQSYYENWNRQYVSAWNAKAMSSGDPFFETIVGYYPTVDYGFELNHELFYYFQYVERVLKKKILANSPHVVLF
jgi:hypothetical protein